MKLRWWKWLLAVGITVVLIGGLFPLGRVYRLLKRAEVPIACVQRIEAQGGWLDLLKYTDGCEWIILQVGEDYLPPEYWHTEPCTDDVLPETFHVDFAQALPPDPCWTAWFYVPVNKAQPFEDQEWLAAFYDAADGLLAVYRGYALYGIN